MNMYPYSIHRGAFGPPPVRFVPRENFLRNTNNGALHHAIPAIQYSAVDEFNSREKFSGCIATSASVPAKDARLQAMREKFITERAIKRTAAANGMARKRIVVKSVMCGLYLRIYEPVKNIRTQSDTDIDE